MAPTTLRPYPAFALFRRWWRYCYGPVWCPVVAIAATLFLGLEFVLVLVGIRPANTCVDPYVGFSGRYPLFEPGEPGSPIIETAEAVMDAAIEIDPAPCEPLDDTQAALESAEGKSGMKNDGTRRGEA